MNTFDSDPDRTIRGYSRGSLIVALLVTGTIVVTLIWLIPYLIRSVG